MTQSELILEYLDGSLDPAVEQELFEMLAGHPELRTTLRGYVQIGEAVRGDREAFTPPVATEAALMRRLGFGVAPSPGVARKGGWFAGLLRSRPFGLASAFIIGVLLTAGALRLVPGEASSSAIATRLLMTGNDRDQASLMLSRQGAEDLASALLDTSGSSAVSSIGVVGGPETAAAASPRKASPSIANAPDHRSPSVLRSASIPVARRFGGGVVNRRNGSRRGAEAISSSSSAANRPALASMDDTASSTTPRMSETLVMTVVPRASSFMIESPTARRASSPSYRRLDGINLVEVDLSMASDRGGIVVELRRGFAGDLVDVDARVPSASPLEESALGGYHHLSPSLAIGAEVGLERYAQRLPVSQGDTIAIEQRPLYLWGGGAMRYYPGEMIGLLPYLQGGIGFSSAGPIVRGRLGLPREIACGLRMGIGLESSTLFYNAAGRGQISGRWGGFGGLEVTLP